MDYISLRRSAVVDELIHGAVGHASDDALERELEDALADRRSGQVLESQKVGRKTRNVGGS